MTKKEIVEELERKWADHVRHESNPAVFSYPLTPEWQPDISFNYETACDMIRLSLKEGVAFPEQAIETAKWVIEGVHAGRLKAAHAPPIEFKDAA